MIVMAKDFLDILLMQLHKGPLLLGVGTIYRSL